MEPYIGQIFYWPLSWAPQGFLLCQGQTLNISSYAALFSILGTTYGGDGKTTFNLPDLRGRVAIGPTTVPPVIPLGKSDGAETVALTADQLPVHTHSVSQSNVQVSVPTTSMPSMAITASLPATQSYGTTATPGPNAFPAKAPDTSGVGVDDYIYANPATNQTIPININIPGGQALTITQPTYGSLTGQPQQQGGNAAHNNIQPFLTINYMIATTGYYPQRW